MCSELTHQRKVAMEYLFDLANRSIPEFTIEEAMEVVKPTDNPSDSWSKSQWFDRLSEIFGGDGFNLTSERRDGVVYYKTPESVRLPGRKSASLKHWNPKKLRDQTLMQVRSDFGGKDAISMIRQVPGLRHLSDVQAAAVRDLVRDKIAGCRERITNKVEELYLRAISLEKATADLTARKDLGEDNTPSLEPKTIKLVVDATSLPNTDSAYADVVLPQLIERLGREPIFGDRWFNGALFLTYSGEKWVG